MTRRARLGLGIVGGSLVAPCLPLYLARTMTRSQTSDGGGDQIAWGWELHTLRGFYKAMTYMRPEEQPQQMLALNLVLAVVYAGVLAALVYFVLPRR